MNINSILGEKTARRLFDAAWARAGTALNNDTVLRQLIVEREMEAQATQAIIAELRGRIIRLEKETHGVTWCGVWSSDRAFPAGGLTTCSGSLWLAVIELKNVRPGESNSCWKLIVKRGSFSRGTEEGSP